jgi:hypothetical protein
METPKNLPVNPPYMIAYTPGKVGSTSIMETLRTVGVPCHRCTEHNIKQYHVRDYPTITGVREPIEWAFSNVFEMALAEGLTLRSEDAEKVVATIMQSAEHGLLKDYCDWWGTHFRQITGVNLFGSRWIKKTPWRIFSLRALVVRTDKMNDVFAEALNKFLPTYYPDIDMSTLEVQHRAKGTDRFEGYDEFMDAVKFDPHWLDRFYDKTPMCRYFFFAAELRDWIIKWAT